mmetsp:Transcript_21959/g.57305  ORF Transcript_21959/g.57305 Transcript_21959/m.57305 type:complete len:300 (-) Transcript_21959:325-1224(-)
MGQGRAGRVRQGVSIQHEGLRHRFRRGVRDAVQAQLRVHDGRMAPLPGLGPQRKAHLQRVVRRSAPRGLLWRPQGSVQEVRQGQEGVHPHKGHRPCGRPHDQQFPRHPGGEVRHDRQRVDAGVPQGPARGHRQGEPAGGRGTSRLGGQRRRAVQEPAAHAWQGAPEHLGPGPGVQPEARQGRCPAHQLPAKAGHLAGGGEEAEEVRHAQRPVAGAHRGQSREQGAERGSSAGEQHGPHREASQGSPQPLRLYTGGLARWAGPEAQWADQLRDLRPSGQRVRPAAREREGHVGRALQRSR